MLPRAEVVVRGRSVAGTLGQPYIPNLPRVGACSPREPENTAVAASGSRAGPLVFLAFLVSHMSPNLSSTASHLSDAVALPDPLLGHLSMLPTALLETAAVVPSAFLLTGAVAICAVGLVLLMQPGQQSLRLGGTVLGLAGFAMLIVEVLKRAVPAGADGGIPPVFPVVFGLLAVVGAVRVMTNPRPVFAALYFMLVVLAGGGMFLLLDAEFMAFALVIVYAGAILITYMFVLMLAQQSPVAGVGEAWYDRMPREAISGVIVGFVILATLSDAYFSPKAQIARDTTMVESAHAGTVASWQRLASMPKLLLETARVANPAVVSITSFDPETGRLDAVLTSGASEQITLPPSMMPDNSRQVGVELVSRFPAGLEIAGVVLLMALFGAVILARKQIELGEDERRTIAGMRRLTVEGEAGGSSATLGANR